MGGREGRKPCFLLKSTRLPLMLVPFGSRRRARLSSYAGAVWLAPPCTLKAPFYGATGLLFFLAYIACTLACAAVHGGPLITSGHYALS